MNGTRVLITGVSGFVGQHLASHLIVCGYEVFGVSRSIHDTSLIPADHAFRCSIMNDQEIHRIIDEVKPDCVIHLATAHGPESRTAQGAQNTLDTNVTGTLSLLEACTIVKPHILLVSSSAVYAPSLHPISEASPLLLNTPYAMSKYAAERCALLYADRYSMPITIVRPFQHSGPGQKPITFVSRCAKEIVEIERQEREPVITISNPDNRRDYLDVRNVVQAYERLLSQNGSSMIYNICSGIGHTIKEIAATLIKLSPVPIELKEISSEEPSSTIGSHEKLTRDTGWKPRYDIIRDTLPSLLDYWRNELQTSSGMINAK